MGKDHSLHAEIPGYVRFYRIQKGRKERRYIGIARERGEKLPRDEASRGRQRYFGLVEKSQAPVAQAEQQSTYYS
jgi:large subunit ribosomal protein L27